MIHCTNHPVGKNLSIVAQSWTLCESLLKLYLGAVFMIIAYVSKMKITKEKNRVKNARKKCNTWTQLFM